MTNLEPCPFCGAEASINYGRTAESVWAYVVCGCGARTRNFHGEDDKEAARAATEMWNRRTNL